MLAIVLLTAVVVFQAGRVQNWFRQEVEIKVHMPVTGSFGLKEGGEVMLLGTHVGRVSQIYLEHDGDMVADISIDAEYLRFVRADSTAYIKKQFGVAGDAFLEIARGTGEPLDLAQPVLTARADESPTAMLGVVMEEVKREFLPMVRDARVGIQAWVQLAAALDQPIRDLNALVVALNGVVGHLERGEGTLGKLLTDDSLLRELRRTNADLNAAVARVGPLLGDVSPVLVGLDQTMLSLRELIGQLQLAAGTLPSTARSVDRVAADLPTLMLETQATLREAQRFLKLLQNHWLFGSGAGAATELAPRIAPDEAMP